MEDKGKQKLWADEEAGNEEDLVLPKCVNIDDSSNEQPPTTSAHLEEGVHLDSAIPARQKASNDFSLLEDSNSDSLNTSDLSPSKVFGYKDEGWQEVQSKKKKKAAQALA